jgi:ssDNA-binding Zn-finger/Zn-ribbon topoisomerase 1
VKRETAREVEVRKKIQQTPPDKKVCPKCGSEMQKKYRYEYQKYFVCSNCGYSRHRKPGEETDGWKSEHSKETGSMT